METVITNVHSTDTMTYRGFNKELFNDMLVIFETLNKSDIGVSARNFYTELFTHINVDRDTHGFEASLLTDEVISDLMALYRGYGYTGSVSDMLKGVLTNLILADAYDISLGIHPSKILDVIGWRLLFKDHSTRLTAHPDVFGDITPKYQYNCEPVFSFTDLFRDSWSPYIEDGYTLDNWNTTTGSIFLEYSFDNKGSMSPFDILTIHCQDRDIIFRMSFEPIPGFSYNKAIFNIVSSENNNIATLGSMDLNTSILIYEKMVITYKHNELYVRGLNSELKISNPFKSIPISLMMNLPFGNRSTKGIHTLSYYSNYMTTKQLLFFLN